MTARAMYVHIPFCEQICFYCDFNKFFIENQPVDEYIDALTQEMRRVLEDDKNQDTPIHSVYIGGGTPTALNIEQLDKVIRNISTFVPLNKEDMECTVEVNPGEADLNKFEVMREAGVNRLSIGIQSFNDSLLKKIGRSHSAKEAVRTVSLARKAGFDNISIDLMFGLPGQSMEIWKDTIHKALELEVSHISAYSLKIEEKTMFYNWYRQGKLHPLPEDLEADMYERLVSILEANGYTAYEISNFAKGDLESTHNKTYWKNEEYYGFGAGAHGYLHGVRYANIGPLPHYMKAIERGEAPIRETHHVTRREMMEEEMFMGLRMKQGVQEDKFIKKYGQSYFDIFGEVIQESKEKGLLYDSGRSLHLTSQGRLLGNEVFENFLLHPDQNETQ